MNAPSEVSPGAGGPRVTALVTEPGRISRLRAAFGDSVRFLHSPSELLAASRSQNVELVFVPPRAQSRDLALTTTVAAIRASRRSPPVYVYGDRSIECARQLMRLARAGARDVILFDVDDDVASLRRLLVRGTVGGAIESVTLALQQAVAPRHLPLFLHCAANITAPPSATGVARCLKVSRRTLSAWARKAGARGVRSLSSKVRVLAAVEMIRRSNGSIEHVAHALGFSSSAHLHNTIRRYTGTRPREAALNDLAFWCSRFFESSRSRGSDEGPRQRVPAG
jgi:AraC-like DNA-binding protein